jgi:integrase
MDIRSRRGGSLADPRAEKAIDALRSWSSQDSERCELPDLVSCSLPASGFHTFRHSAASIVNEQTGNLKLAQKFLGHSTIKMTADIYTHTSAEAERGAAIALERAIYVDLFPVVPNIENRNNFAALN